MKLKCVYTLLFIFSLISCKEKKSSNTAVASAIPVVTQLVLKTNVADEILVSGNMEGNKTVKLGFLVGGKVNFITAEEGEMIKNGQLLASLDPESYTIANNIAQASLDQVQDEYNRLSQMHDRKSIAESDFSKVTNSLKMARAQQRLQAKNLADTKLYSPLSGVLLKRGAEEGEIVGVGLPLFVVSDIRNIKVNAAIPESELNQVHAGMEASVYVASVDSTFTGEIIEIGSLAEAATRSFTVKIELNNPQMLIRPGMTAEVRLVAGKSHEMITIPADAVLHDLDNSSYVFVSDKIRKQAFKRIVSLGRIVGSQIEITSGLTNEEWIVVGGQHRLADGSSIEIK